MALSKSGSTDKVDFKDERPRPFCLVARTDVSFFACQVRNARKKDHTCEISPKSRSVKRSGIDKTSTSNLFCLTIFQYLLTVRSRLEP
ncbi:hypothetical protein TMatcc_002767 [Talaromyces marneffei ATCC 18224]